METTCHECCTHFNPIMTKHLVWLIYTIHHFVWLFLNTAIVFLTYIKSDIYLDSLSANRAMFFISHICKRCHYIVKLEHRNKTNQLTWENIFWKWTTTRELVTRVNVKWLTGNNKMVIIVIIPGNNKNVSRNVESTV